MKYSERESKSLFTINKMNAHRDVFDDCIWKEKEAFEKVFHKLRDNHNNFDTVTVEKSNLSNEKKKLIEEGYELFLVCSGIVRVKKREAFKLYFVDFDSTNTRGNLKNIYSALSNALVLTKNDNYNCLNKFKGEITTIVNNIFLFLSEKAERLSELEISFKEKKDIEDEWDEEYKSLKRYLKAYFTKRKDHTDKEFFEKKKVKHKNEDSKDDSKENLKAVKDDLAEIKEDIIDAENKPEVEKE